MILSQFAFAFGACGGLLMTRRPVSAKTALKASVNWPPRSRIKNLSFVVSVSRRKLRAAWVTHDPVGLAVTLSK